MFSNDESGNTTFVNIVSGRFAIKVDKETPGAVERKNKNGETVYELLYNTVSGLITGIEKKETDYGNQWNVTLSENGKRAVVSFPYSSRMADGFLRRIENVNLSEPVALKVFTFDEKTYMTVNQNGQKIDMVYTKDNPNGLPEMKQVKVKGELIWDDTEKMEFLEKMVMEKIVPKLPKPVETPQPQTTGQNDSEAADVGTDDLPF